MAADFDTAEGTQREVPVTSYKLLHIPIGELNLIRITCRTCGAAIEVPIEEITPSSRLASCGACGAAFYSPSRNAASELANALFHAARDNRHGHIEFVVPVSE